jgi:hypothetical protein
VISDRDRFYQERDQRTADYGVGADRLESPVGLAVGEAAASSLPGQVVTLALVNMAARVHRRLHIEVPAVPLVAPTLVEATDLREACLETACAIDPFVGIEVNDKGWMDDDVPSVGIGGPQRPCRLYVGADGWSASLDPNPQAIDADAGTVMGAGLAAMLGAAALMQGAFGRRPAARRLSLWRFQDGNEAEPGPRGSVGPLDLGDVLVVGAGAVASAFFYWCCQVELVGHWEVVDGDRVVLHNTNRALTFLAADAGWPNGIQQGPGVMKVQVAARGLPVRPFAGWYENWRLARGDRRPDLVLPLANDFDARHAVGQLGENILVHATTSPTWTAQLHRHIAGRDDCIDCRVPSGSQVRFGCAQAPLPPTADASGGRAADAALPFLSGGAGLLLLASLLQLQEGALAGLPHNHWRLILELGPRRTLQGGIHSCREGCSQVLSPTVRRVLNAGTRWADIA